MSVFVCKECLARTDGIKGDWRENAEKTGQTLYCPNGHAIGFARYPFEED